MVAAGCRLVGRADDGRDARCCCHSQEPGMHCEPRQCQQHPELQQQQQQQGFTKPRTDSSTYGFITLEANGLRALVVHDPEADKAAVSCDVNVGSLLDPPEFLGLAHFTEHMLFYSSDKFPEEDAYSKFVSEAGGLTNAYTAAEDTNYSFDVNWDSLEPAMERFACFFSCPLISKDGVNREINAVDSEHGKNLQLDAWRQLQLAKHLANPSHPFSRFATGNKDTLGDEPRSKGLDVRQAVVDFHTQHYSSNLMRLAVVSRHSLDEMEAMVRRYFADVPNRHLPVPTFSSDVFLPSQQRTLVKMVPVRDVHSVEWAWQLPPATPLYRKAPLNIISHLLGHEGKGSVFALLRTKGWATSLVAGESGLSLSCASFFYVRVELTEEGHKQVGAIGTIIFAYLELIKAQGVTREVFDEVAALSRLRFDFRDKLAPYAYATSLASGMQHYPDQDLLLAMYHVPLEWDPECVRRSLELMSCDRVRVCWMSQSHQAEATEVEPWYGTKFVQGPVPDEWMQSWQGAEQSCEDLASGRLHLPEANPFIPSDLELKADDAAGPSLPLGPAVLLEEQGSLRLWHRCDVTFQAPKAIVYVDLQLPEAYASPHAAVCTRLFVKLLADALSELAYPAELAGLYNEVSSTQSGFQITVSGYNDKLHVLLGAILERAATLHAHVPADRYAVMAEQLHREYANLAFSQVYSWTMYRRELLLNTKRWPVSEYTQVLPHITPTSLGAFIKRLFSQCFVEVMAVGNVRAAEARGMAAQVQQVVRGTLGALPVFPSQVRDLRTVRLPTGTLTLLEEPGPDHANVNSAVSVLYQAGPDDPSLARNALLELLVHVCKREAFNVLRTQQQLGYVVSLHTGQELGVHHAEFIIQSTAYSASHLAAHVDAFVAQLLGEFLPAKCGLARAAAAPKPEGAASEPQQPAAEEPAAAAASDEFAKAVKELSKALLEKPKRLGEVAQCWWHEIFFGLHVFDRRERVVAALQQLCPEQLLGFARELLADPATRRKAVVAVQGTNTSTSAKDGGSGGTAAPPADTSAGGSAAEGTQAANTVMQRGSTEELVLRVHDLHEFKRGCEVWPSSAGLYARWRQEFKVPHITRAPDLLQTAGAASAEAMVAASAGQAAKL